MGSGAGNVMTTASKCVLIGAAAGTGALTGDGTTDETTADGIVAIGYAAANSLGVSVGSMAIGHRALATHTTGARNMAIGYNAMTDTDAGSTSLTSVDNTFIGYFSGGGTWTDAQCNNNVAIGNYTMDGALNGALNNTAVGIYSLSAIIDGDMNTAIGRSSGSDIQDGVSNTCIGGNAGDTIVDGNYNTYLGYNADASGSSVASEIVIAATSSVLQGGGAETCRIGLSSDYVTLDFGEDNAWVHSSDVRIKKDIENNELGLAFINDLRTVTFKKKAASEYPEEFEQYDASKTERTKPNKVHYGFIAQEVKEAMDKAGHSEFTVWKENRDGMQELGETQFITPLIKAVQELSAQVEELKNK